jgi:hypothetical protein
MEGVIRVDGGVDHPPGPPGGFVSDLTEVDNQIFNVNPNTKDELNKEIWGCGCITIGNVVYTC